MNIQQEAGRLKQYGIVPLPVEPGGKVCRLVNWQKHTIDDAPDIEDGHNMAALLGGSSNDLVAADLDWSEAKQLAPHLLPETNWISERMHSDILLPSHYLYQSVIDKTLKFPAPKSLRTEGKNMIIELLSGGAYVVMPGSSHSGTTVKWRGGIPTEGPKKAQSASLRKRVEVLAGAALIVRLWPDMEGMRNDVLLPLVGSCIHAGWPERKIIDVFKAILQCIDDPELRSRVRNIKGTIERSEAGDSICGLPKLAEYLDQDVIDSLKRWWGLGDGVVLTSNGVPLTAAPVIPTPINGSEWPELLEFEELCRSNIRDYPLYALGPVMQAAVEILVRVQQVPAPLAVQSILSAVTNVVQSRYCVLRDGRPIGLSVWMIAVATTGERKTSTDELAYYWIEQRMKEAESLYNIQSDQYKAAKMDKESELVLIQPRSPSWIITGGTTEGILSTLDRHWPAMTLNNNDAGSWVAGYSMREGREHASIATLSSLWSGSYQSSVKASADRPPMLRDRRLSLSLMLQPSLAGQLLDDEVNADQGFLSRCLPCFPASNIGNRQYRNLNGVDLLQPFYDRLDGIMQVPVRMDMVTGALSFDYLEMTDGARSAWIAAHDRYERDLIGKYRSIQAQGNKAAEQVLRLAGIQAVIEGTCSGNRTDPLPPPIGLDDVTEVHKVTLITNEQISNAVALVDYYLDQWLDMSSQLVAHQADVLEPKQLWDWMVRRFEGHEQDVFTLRSMYHGGPRFLRDKSQKAKRLVTDLLRRGYVKLDGKGYRMRPTNEMPK